MNEEILKKQIKDELRCQYSGRASVMFNKETKELSISELKSVLEDVLNRHQQFYQENLELYKKVFGETFKREISKALHQ